MGHYEEFTKFRQDMNKRILEEGTLEIKRFFGIDEKAYHPGALDARTKELMGLATSMVLRCDDCAHVNNPTAAIVIPAKTGAKNLDIM